MPKSFSVLHQKLGCWIRGCAYDQLDNIISGCFPQAGTIVISQLAVHEVWVTPCPYFLSPRSALHESVAYLLFWWPLSSIELLLPGQGTQDLKDRKDLCGTTQPLLYRQRISRPGQGVPPATPCASEQPDSWDAIC